MPRAFSYLLTGSEDQHKEVRLAVINHMRSSEFVAFLGAESIDQYLARTQMDRDGTWGTDMEIQALVHKLRTPVYCYHRDYGNYSWSRISPVMMGMGTHDDFSQPAMYIDLSLIHI